jgi:Xaa-Pro aminopeptidase
MSDKNIYVQRLELLRKWMKQYGLSYFIVNAYDEFLNEDAPLSGQRLNWISGFTGTMGEVLIGLDRAVFFADARYSTQAKRQLDKAFHVYDLFECNIFDYLLKHLKPEEKVGCYPWVWSVSRGRKLEDIVSNMSGQFVIVDKNPIDDFWLDRPPSPHSKAVVHPLCYAGKEFSEKLQVLQKDIQKLGLDYYIYSNLNSIAWLLNMRGQDSDTVPIVYSYLIVPQKGPVELFVDDREGLQDLIQHWGPLVATKPLEDFPKRLKGFSEQNLALGYDPIETPFAVEVEVSSPTVKIKIIDDISSVARAKKNPIEVEGARLAHIHDGLAIIRSIFWIEQNIGKAKEFDLGQVYTRFRQQSPLFKTPSFNPIIGFGSNSSLIHYRPIQSESKQIDGNGLLLMDTGGNYLCGTTDVTRTIPIGEATEEQKDAYTRVLKGYIALSTIVFPEGVKGYHLDILARQYLWQKGYDYQHATGHGVGSYLYVHETPLYIGASTRYPHPAEVGMIVSNEPGYYKNDEFGIRIESLMVVQPHSSQQYQFSGASMLCFETLTRVPIDKRLMKTSMLSPQEIDWLDGYHQKVWDDLSPHIKEDECNLKQWLWDACQPL